MKTRIFLILILVLAFILRFYQLSSIPPALYWDEVSIGYNAWSILQTGADEYGRKFPIFFESFQEYKLPGYIYSAIPTIAVFGLNELGVRIPSVLFGLLSILSIYLFVSEIFNRKTALICAFFLAVCPWQILFSRAGFEANSALAILTIAFYFFSKKIKIGKFPSVGLYFLIFTQYFYNSFRVFVPLFLFFSIVIFRHQVKINKKELFSAFLISSLLFVPFIINFIQSKAINRFSYVSIFNNQDLLQSSVKQRIFDQNNFISRIIHHRYLVYSKEIMKNYFSHFSFDFLFFNRDNNPRHSISGVGLIYLWLFPFIIRGFYELIKNKDQSLSFLIPWLLLAPLASSITTPAPHALRSFLMLPPLLIFCSYGLNIYLKKKVGFNQKLFFFFIISFCLFSTFNFLHQLLVHYSNQSSRDWAYGYKEVFSYIQKNKFSYNNFYVSGKYWRPYIFALFYMKYPPNKYKQDISHTKLDNIYFGHADYDTSDPYYNYQLEQDIKDTLRKEKNSLLVVSPEEVFSTDNVILTISDLENKPLFLFVDNR